MQKIQFCNRQIFTLGQRFGGYFEFNIIELRPGIAILQVNGPNVSSIFGQEAGGHRWQHTSGDRIHTSTITIAVLKEPSNIELNINPNDLDIRAIRGSGDGGQKMNKTSSTIVITHIPSKIVVRCQAERSQFRNKELAMKTLRARLWQEMENKSNQSRCQTRNSQIGSGMRGDKRRTIQVQHNIVKDHIDGRQWRYQDYLKGNWKF